MHLKSLRLHDFRSYEALMLLPPQGVTVIVGENGAGKTNLLEAVHLCCVGKSHRTSTDTEMIMYQKETAAVQLVVQRRDGDHDVGVRLYRNQKKKKVLFINAKPAKRMGEMMGHATCVMFSPEDLSIVKEGPQGRRKFLDILLSQRQGAYFYALQKYQSVLKQRNALLKVAFKVQQLEAQLDLWDEQLSEAAMPVIRMRYEAVSQLNTLSKAHYAYISDREDEELEIEYKTQFKQYSTKEDVKAMLKERRQEDIRRQVTSVGPHRDDLILSLKGKELRSFGSQGQVRTAALALRLSSFDMLSMTQEEPPLLLLDDVLSELDPMRRKKLISRIKNAQALLTCTDKSDFVGATPACVLRVEDGKVFEEKGDYV